MDKKFTITFGQQPASYIERESFSKQIYDDFDLDYPFSHIYIICGVRGSGKTVLMTNISKKFKSKKDWIVIDVNPNREMLEQIASGIYDNTKSKHLFTQKSFSFSFHGVGFTLEGKEPVSNIKSILGKMLDRVKKDNKKVLITIDEASNNTHMRAFAHDFQSLLREDYPVFALMTGLYENVNSLQNNKNLTFLYRTPKIDLKPLDIKLIIKEYTEYFKESSQEEIKKLADLTKGFAFAYQAVGFLYSKYGNIKKLLDEYDKYLAIYVYDKLWEYLPEKEKEFLMAFDDNCIKTDDLILKLGISKKEYSVYRDRLIKKGIIEGNSRGKLTLILPRFNVYISKQV